MCTQDIHMWLFDSKRSNHPFVPTFHYDSTVFRHISVYQCDVAKLSSPVGSRRDGGFCSTSSVETWANTLQENRSTRSAALNLQAIIPAGIKHCSAVFCFPFVPSPWLDAFDRHCRKDTLFNDITTLCSKVRKLRRVVWRGGQYLETICREINIL